VPHAARTLPHLKIILPGVHDELTLHDAVERYYLNGGRTYWLVQTGLPVGLRYRILPELSTV